MVFDPPSPPKGGCIKTTLNRPLPTLAAPACRWLLAALHNHRHSCAPTAAGSGSGASTSGVRHSRNIMGHEYAPHHVAGRPPSGCPLEADYTPWGGRFFTLSFSGWRSKRHFIPSTVFLTGLRSLRRSLRTDRLPDGIRFTGCLPRQSADSLASWRSNTSRHHAAGRTPSGCLR